MGPQYSGSRVTRDAVEGDDDDEDDPFERGFDDGDSEEDDQDSAGDDDEELEDGTDATDMSDEEEDEREALPQDEPEDRAELRKIMATEQKAVAASISAANKQDAEDCVEVVRIKEGLVRRVIEGEKGASVRDSRVLPLSALTGTGVKEAVDWVCSRVKWNKEGRPPVMR